MAYGAPESPPILKVLVTGANGFIGRQVVAALLAAGHAVRYGGRDPRSDAQTQRDAVACDYARDTDPAVWLPRLNDIDAVVNCAGILRERGADRFEAVHVATPTALWSACATAGVRRVIQISALGDPADGEVIASKHRGDGVLVDTTLDWTILRPSVVYSARGSYGGTSLLRAMAALPGVLLLPGAGTQRLQPISAEDLGALVVRLIDTRTGSHRIVEVAGPEVVSLEAYLLAWRRWLRLPPPRVWRVPAVLVGIAAGLGERFGSGPLGRTMQRMLTRGNIAGPTAVADLTMLLGYRPRSLDEVLETTPSFGQDRWHARLYLLGPLLRVALGLVWVASAVVGFITPQPQIRELLASAHVEHGAVALVYAASCVDLVLGLLLLSNRRIVLTGGFMLLSLIGYTAFIGLAMPAQWLEPFGGLLKNLALMPAVLVLMALADRK